MKPTSDSRHYINFFFLQWCSCRSFRILEKLQRANEQKNFLFCLFVVCFLVFSFLYHHFVAVVVIRWFPMLKRFKQTRHDLNMVNQPQTEKKNKWKRKNDSLNITICYTWEIGFLNWSWWINLPHLWAGSMKLVKILVCNSNIRQNN